MALRQVLYILILSLFSASEIFPMPKPFQDQLQLNEDDMILPEKGGAFIFRRSHNGASLFDGPLGMGWGFNFGSTLIFNSEEDKILIKDGNGLITVFEKAGENEYRIKSGDGESIFIQPDGRFERKIKKAAVQVYSPDGLLEKISDSFGHVFQLIYRGEDLFLILTPSGREISVETNEIGKITSVSEPGGKQVQYQYNEKNQLVSVKNMSGRQTKYFYDDENNITEITYPDGGRQEFSYKKGSHKITGVKGPGEHSIQYEYFGQKGARITFNSGYQLVYQDDLEKRVRIVSDNDGIKNILKYDEAGRLIENRDSLGRLSSYEYEAEDRMTKAVDLAGNAMEYVYDPATGFLLEEKLNGRTRRQYVYDAFGNIISMRDEQGLLTRYTYDAEGELESLTDAKGRLIFLSYDTFGNISQKIQDGKRKMLYQYDEYGRLIEETDAWGNKTSHAYNENGDLVKTVFPGELSYEYTYDDFGHRIKEARSDGASQEFGFENGRIVKKVNWEGGVYAFKYNADGKITKEIKPSGSENTYAYNIAGFLTEAKDALGHSAHFFYDSAGRLIKKIYPIGTEIEFSYDAADRLIGKKTSSGKTTSWNYNSGQLSEEIVSGENASISRYDDAGRLISFEDKSSGFKAGLDYDARGNIAAMSYPDGESMFFYYDELNRLLSAKNKAGQGVEFEYSDSGVDYRVRYSNGVLEEYHFDSSGNLKDFLASFKGKALFGFTLARNIFGAVIEKQFLSGVVQKFEYDKSGRIIKFYQSGKVWEKYHYDADGNIFSVERPRGKTTFSYDAADHLISDGTFKYEYDANGNLVRKTWNGTAVTFAFNEGNQLSKISSSSGNACSFLYDPAGNRNAADTNGGKENYFYVHGNRIVDFNPEGRINRVYFHNLETNNPVFLKENSGIYFFHYDESGNVIALSNDKGEVVNQYIYSPFGNTLVKKESVKNPFQFMGKEYEETFGLYFDGERFYDPATMRFLSAGLTWNENIHIYAGEESDMQLPESESSASLESIYGPAAFTVAGSQRYTGENIGIQDWEHERQMKNHLVGRNEESNLNILENFVKNQVETNQIRLKHDISLSNIRELIRKNMEGGPSPLDGLLETPAERAQRERQEREAAYGRYGAEQEKVNLERREQEKDFEKNVLPQIQDLIIKARGFQSNAQAIAGKLQGAVQTVKGIEDQVSSVVNSAQGLSGKVNQVNGLLQAARNSSAAILELNIDKNDVIDIYAKVQNASQWACHTNDSMQASSQASSAGTAAARVKSMTARALQVCSSARSQLVQIHTVKKQAEAVQAEAKNIKVQLGKLNGLLESAKATINAVENTKAEIQSALAEMVSVKNEAKGILSSYSTLLKAQAFLVQINTLGSKLNADDAGVFIQEGNAVIARIQAEIQEAAHAQEITIPEFNTDFGTLDSKVEDICASADMMDTYESKINAEVLKARGCANSISQGGVYLAPVKKNIPNPPSGWSPVGESVAGPVKPGNDAQSAARQSADEEINGNDSSTEMNPSGPGQTQQPSSGMPQPPQKPNGPKGPGYQGYQ